MDLADVVPAFELRAESDAPPPSPWSMGLIYPWMPSPPGPVEVEVLDLLEAADHASAWSDLAGRALERNPFLEPAFALAAARHLREVGRPMFVMLWRTGAPRNEPGALLGVLLLATPRFGLGVATMEIKGWRHKQAVLGTPIVDRRLGFEVFATLLAWLKAAMPNVGGLLLHDIAEDGPAAAALRAAVLARGLTVTRFGEHQRAVLAGGDSFDAHILRALSAKKRKEIARLRRRLGERGELNVVSARSPAEVRRACEAFLVLESSGWKGRSGTAFAQTASGAAFLRAATRSLAEMGQCRIDMLEIGGRVIAAGLVLGDEDRSLYWKTSYDEDYAAFSPGVLLTLAITQEQLGRGVAVTDSCAVADHPMIDHLWLDRIAVADWLVSLAPASATASRAVILSETAKRELSTRLRQFRSRLARCPSKKTSVK